MRTKGWALVCLLVAASPAFGDDPLVDLLRQKKVLSQEEYERLKGTSMPAEQREGLIDVLRQKGVLTNEEAVRLEAPEPVMPAAAPTESPVAVAVAPTPGPTTAPQVGYDDGFFIRTEDGKFSAKFGTRFSEQFIGVQPGTQQNSTAYIDRARFAVEATFFKVFKSKIEVELAAADRGLRDAYLSYVPMPEINAQLGQFKVPFSYEALTSKRYVDFVERASAVRGSVDPSRDIGAMLYGQVLDTRLLYQLAILNGTGQNRRDNNSAKDVAFRIFATPFAKADLGPLDGVSFGGAVTYGYESPIPGSPNSAVGISETDFEYYPRLEIRGHRVRGNGQVAWYSGPFTITGEYIHTREERNGLGVEGANLAPLKTDGGYFGGTWLVTGETKPMNKRVRPASPFLWPLGPAGPGAWELAARGESYNLQHTPDAPDDILARNRYNAALAGVNWYPIEFVRFSLNYVYGYYLEAGEDQSPDPDRHSVNAILARAQIEF